MGKIADFLKKMNLTDDQLKEHQKDIDDLDAELEKKPEPTKEEPLKTEPKKESEPVAKTSETTSETTDLIAQIDALLDRKIAPIAEKVDTLEKDVQSKASNEKTQRIEKILADAVSAGRIEPAKKDEWKKDLEESFDIAERAILRLPENENLKKESEKREDKSQTGDGTKSKPSTGFARSVDPKYMKQISEDLAENE